MRNYLIATLALTAVLHAGCFTAFGAAIGAIADSGSSRPSPRRPSPVRVSSAPGASPLAFTGSRAARPVDDGYGVARGALIGAAIDTAIAVGVLIALSHDDRDCGDDGECY